MRAVSDMLRGGSWRQTMGGDGQIAGFENKELELTVGNRGLKRRLSDIVHSSEGA